MQRLLPSTLLIAIGCVSTVTLDVPLEPDTEAVLFIMEQEELSIFAQPAAAIRAGHGLAADGVVHLLLYRSSLEALMINPGSVTLVDGDPGCLGPSVRSLPTPTAVYSVDLSVDSGLQANSELQTLLSTMHIAAPDLASCKGPDHCLGYPDEHRHLSDLRCVPCSEMVREDPAQPERPKECEGVGCPSEPFAPRLRDCDALEAHFLGSDQCRTVSNCSSGQWSAPPVGAPDRVRYVRAGSLGGSGTSTDPFGSLEEALTDVTEPTLLLVAAGVYTTPVQLADQAWIHGHCPRETRIENEVRLRMNRTATISNLQIDHDGVEANLLSHNSRLFLDRVVITGDSNHAILMFDSELYARDLLIRVKKRGIKITTSVLSLSDSYIEHESVGLETITSTVTLRSVVLQRTSSTESDEGVGLQLETAQLEASRLLIEDAAPHAIFAQVASTARFSDLVIRGAHFSPMVTEDRRGGNGLLVHRTTLEVDRALITSIRGYGIRLYGGTGRFSDITVIDGQAGPDTDHKSIGFEVQGERNEQTGEFDSATATVTRLRVENVDGTGVKVYGAASADLSDITVHEASMCGVCFEQVRRRRCGAVCERLSTLQRAEAVNATRGIRGILVEDVRVEATDLLVSGFDMGIELQSGFVDGEVFPTNADISQFQITKHSVGVRLGDLPGAEMSRLHQGSVDHNDVGITSPCFDLLEWFPNDNAFFDNRIVAKKE